MEKKIGPPFRISTTDCCGNGQVIARGLKSREKAQRFIDAYVQIEAFRAIAIEPEIRTSIFAERVPVPCEVHA